MFSHPWVAAFLAFGLACGCGSMRTRPVQSFIDAPVGGEVLVADVSSWRLVALAGYRSERDDEGRLMVMVDLKNLSGLDLPVEIRTVFYGADGEALKAEAEWSKVVMTGNSGHHHSALSKNHLAVSFSVLIRTP